MGISQVVAQTEAYGAHRTPPSTALRTLRAINGLSAARLAALADVDRTTVARLEQGIGRPQKRTARKLAAVLGCPPELLFNNYNDVGPAGNGPDAKASDSGAQLEP